MEENCYIQYVDASHFYEYRKLVESRKKYFNLYVNARNISAEPIMNKLSKAVDILSMDLIRKRYAGIWNHNYRTCSDIFDNLFNSHEGDIQKCIKLLNAHEDGYDKIGDSYYGASAVFLNLICRVFKQANIWGPNYLSLVSLGLKQGNKVSELTTLSRLILTYMSNSLDEKGNPIPVSIRQLFEEFGTLYTADEICRCIANMLIRDTSGTWRRPIFYHQNAINDGTIEQNLKKQWEYFKRGDNYDYTEFLLCDCGFTHINRIVFEFEFFSVRLNGIDQKPLYIIDDIQEIQSVIDKVQQSISDCCQNMIFFKALYQHKKNIRSNEEYVRLHIHPRTYQRNPQLHTERVIFSHISYLDHCRCYKIRDPKCDFDRASEICRPFFNGIENYLTLYSKHISPISPNRISIYEGLLHQLSAIRKAKTKDGLLQRIEA